MKSDQYFMAQALKLAELGRYSTQPNPRVACMVVKDGEVVGQGYHQYAGQAHAEIIALKQAGIRARSADVYVTLEPCSHHGRTPPCAEALIKSQPARVVIAMSDPNPLVAGKGIEMLNSAGIETRTGVCRAEAEALNRGFIMRMQQGRPYVTLKLAASLDGRIAMRSGESSWITSAASRRDVHRLRLESCAIVTGIGTVVGDNPRMTARVDRECLADEYTLGERQPLRVVLDSQGRLVADALIRQQAGELLHIVSEQLDAAIRPAGSYALPVSGGGIDLHALMALLAEREANSLLVEAGGKLAAGFIRAGLVDELVIYQSPDIMGASAQAMINLPDILKMDEKIRFQYRDVRKIGRDLKLTLCPENI